MISVGRIKSIIISSVDCGSTAHGCVNQKPENRQHRYGFFLNLNRLEDYLGHTKLKSGDSVLNGRYIFQRKALNYGTGRIRGQGAMMGLFKGIWQGTDEPLVTGALDSHTSYGVNGFSNEGK